MSKLKMQPGNTYYFPSTGRTVTIPKTMSGYISINPHMTKTLAELKGEIKGLKEEIKDLKKKRAFLKSELIDLERIRKTDLRRLDTIKKIIEVETQKYINEEFKKQTEELNKEEEVRTYLEEELVPNHIIS